MPPTPAASLIDQIQSSVAPALALLAGMQLGLFTRLGDRERTAAEVAEEIGCDAGRLARLFYALTSVGLLEGSDGRFRNGAEAAEVLVAGKPGYLGGGHELLAKLWAADLNTATSIMTGKPAAEHDFARATPEEAAAFVRALGPGGLAFGRMLAREIDLGAVRSVIDIGGGAGTVLAGLQERWPHLRLTLLELPGVIVHAAPVLGDLGATGVTEETGDILRGPSRTRHDLAVMRAVVQVLSAGDAARAIRHAGESLNPGGEIVIAGSGILDDDRVGPRNGVFINLTFLNLYRDGEAWTEAQYRGWMKAAGFERITRAVLPDGTNLFRARKPG